MTKSRYFLALLGLLIASMSVGCTTVGSINKAPILKIHTGGSTQERKQEFTLKQVKWQHTGGNGRVLGNKYFTDVGRPISGARIKDTLFIRQGKYQGSYTIKKVIRLRTQRRTKSGTIRVVRKVILKLAEPLNPSWLTAHQGAGGTTLKNNVFTDTTSFLPEVPIGSRIKIGSLGSKNYTVIGVTIVKVQGLRQRIAYKIDQPLPKGLKGASFQVLRPNPAGNKKLSYHIQWRGSQLTGHFFTIGINRRRYSQKEMEALLKSNPKSKENLTGTASKQGAALVLRYSGVVGIVVGGFLALVRRDDFKGSAQAIPWGIVAGGAALIGTSIPISASANNDYLRSAKSFNLDIGKKLGIKRKKKLGSRLPLPPSQASRLKAKQ